MYRSVNAPPAQMAGTGTILVVDDSEGVQALSRCLLEEAGYHVVAAGTGTEAIRWLTGNRADLVLLDFRLPDMTGRDVVRVLAEQGRKFPFVAITAHGDEKLAVEMMKLGAIDYLEFREQHLASPATDRPVPGSESLSGGPTRVLQERRARDFREQG